jgi:cyclopropane-fatty-acyl-phospholipid synthase
VAIAGDAMFEAPLLKYLSTLRERRPLPIEVELWDGRRVELGPSPRVGMRLRSASAARALMKPSLDALGEAYVEGLIDVDGEIGDLVEVAASLAGESDERQGKGTLPTWLAKHTRKTDRSAIEYHYDVSNEFYARFLDERMVYSCAYFDDPARDLASAQLAKLDHVCRKLRLAPGERMLDIGCGWGAMAIHAAQRYGVRVVGITLSQNQHALAVERVRAAGLADRIEIRLQDYRDLAEPEGFDKISSIGMFEHVGLKNLGEYFAIVRRLLKPDGLAMNHGITSSDVDSRSVGLGAGEFIDRYVFPDGELPHVALAIRELSGAGLELVDAESLRRHYALTLRHWSANFERHRGEMERLAGEKRARIWRVYLAGCAHAFAVGWINIYQLLAVRSEAGSSPLPLTRDYMYRDPAG